MIIRLHLSQPLSEIMGQALGVLLLLGAAGSIRRRFMGFDDTKTCIDPAVRYEKIRV